MVANINFNPIILNSSHPTQRHHQQIVFDASVGILESPVEHRAKVIMACGGGKTLNEHDLIVYGFDKLGHNIQVVVAPSIALGQQHIETCEGWGLFDKVNDVGWLAFRTGDDDLDEADDKEMTTDPGALINFIERNKRSCIFTTYKSLEKLYTTLENSGITVDAAYYDEFHHLISRQSIDRKKFIETLWPKKNMFFSASEKCGNIVSSMNKKLFGRKIADVTYRDLRKVGVVTPDVKITMIRRKNLSRILFDEAEKFLAKSKGVDLDVAINEGATTIIAQKHMLKTNAHANFLSFGKSVPVNSFLNDSLTFKNALLLNTIVNTVNANTSQVDRKNIFNKIKKAQDSILLQYGIVKEGIDLTAFNAIIIQRGMSAIGIQQAIGRAMRADPADTKALLEGRITLDNPREWVKYYAHVYIVVDDENDQNYIKAIIEKIVSTGLTRDDFTLQEIADQRSGVPPENLDGLPEIEGTVSDITVQDLNKTVEDYFVDEQNREVAEAAQRRIDNEVERIAADVSKMTDKEYIERLLEK